MEFGGEGRAGERAAGEDGDGVGIVLVERCDFFAADFDVGLGGDEVGDAAREFDAVDGEGVAGGNGAGVGGLEEEGVGAAHLLFEQPGRGVFAFTLEGVGADELGEVGGLVGFGGAEGTHLGEDDVTAEAGGLQCGFGSGESAADYVDRFHHFLGYGVGGSEGGEGFVGEAHDAPLGEDAGADALVDGYRVFVPLEDIPLEAGAALVDGDTGEAREESFADAVAAEGWGDVEIFEADAVVAAPGGVGGEVEGKAGGGAVVVGDEGGEAGGGSPAVAEEVGFSGLDGVGLAFEVGEFTNEAKDGGDVGGRGGADGEGGLGHG